MSGRVFRRCGCRDESGKQLGFGCPKLGQKGHGTWSYMVDVQSIDGRRRQMKRGGFRTKSEALNALDEVSALSRTGHQVDDKITVGAWLDLWLAEKVDPSGVSAAGRTLRHNTSVSYEQQIRDYLKPKLGSLPLSKLTADDISRAYRAVMRESAEKAARAQREGRRARALGPTSLKRIHACLRAALNVAVKARRIPYNPALGVELPGETKRVIQPWEPHELGKFLDSVQTHRLGALFEVLAACGLRRGEAIGLKWSDLDVERGTLTIRRQLLNAWADGGTGVRSSEDRIG